MSQTFFFKHLRGWGGGGGGDGDSFVQSIRLAPEVNNLSYAQKGMPATQVVTIIIKDYFIKDFTIVIELYLLLLHTHNTPDVSPSTELLLLITCESHWTFCGTNDKWSWD